MWVAETSRVGRGFRQTRPIPELRGKTLARRKEASPMSHWTEQLFSEHPEKFQPILEGSVERGEEQVDAILGLIDDVYDFRPASVLDVGCGIGRHVTAFADRGIEAHGLDLGAEYIEQAEERAEGEGIDRLTSFYDRDMREVDDLTAEFDLVTSIYSFGFFDDETNEGLLKSIRDVLSSDGVLLLKTFDKVGRLVDFDNAEFETVEGVTYAISREYDPVSSRRRSEGYLLEDGAVIGDYEFDVRLYTPIEMRDLMTTTGYGDIHLFSDFKQGELTRASDTQVVLGRA